MDWRWFFRQRILKPKYLFRDVWWWILHRTFKRFNKVELRSLKPGYYDSDDRMLHACFQLLVDFVEKEKPFEWWGWDQVPGNMPPEAVEIRALYAWWKESYLKRVTPLEQLPQELCPSPFSTWKRKTDGSCSFGPEESAWQEFEYPAYSQAVRETLELENRWDKEEEENLIRLMKIRTYLWT